MLTLREIPSDFSPLILSPFSPVVTSKRFLTDRTTGVLPQKSIPELKIVLTFFFIYYEHFHNGIAKYSLRHY